MSRLKNMATAVRAASYLSPQAMWGHAARRLRNKTVRFASKAYRDRLQARADALPRFSPGEAIRIPVQVTSTFFRAKHAKNAESCLSGRFTFLNKTVDFGSADAIDWSVQADDGNHQLWRANLGFMGYLCPAAERFPQAALALGAKLADSFLRIADFSEARHFEELWHPYGTSQRSLALASALSVVPAELRETDDWRRLEAFLRLNIAFIQQNLETELGLNHLERNLSALALYSLGAERRTPAIERLLRQAVPTLLRRELGHDGVQLERSAMYQALTIQSLRIFDALSFWSAGERRQISAALAAAEAALVALSLGDGQPVMFNDSWMGETPPARDIIDLQPPRFRALTDAGYVRLSDDQAVVVFDAGPIGVDSNPGHGHADFLAIEASIGEHRLIVDPGTYSYTIGSDGGAVRHETRSWTAHNGPAFSEATPVQFRGSFKVGRRAAARLDTAAMVGDDQVVAGSLTFAEAEVSRRLVLRPSGRLEIEDRWIRGPGERRTRMLVPAFWSLEQEPDGIVLRRDRHTVRITWAQDVEVDVGSSQFSRYYNVWEPAHELIFRPGGETASIVFAWKEAAAAERPAAPATARASRRRVESIVAFPKRQALGSALYNALLYNAIEELGVTVHDYRRFFGAQTDGSVFHFHWPDRVFGGLGKLQERFGALGVKRFLKTLSDYRQVGRPVVWTVHNFLPHDFRNGAYAHLYDEIAPHLATDVDGFIFLSRYSLECFLEEHKGVSRDQCAVIPHMITPISDRAGETDEPPELADIRAGASFFLTPGHIRRYKSIETSIALFDRIKAPGQLFVIAGPPTDAGYDAELRAAFGARPDILIIDRMLWEHEMNWCYQNAHAVLSMRSADGNSGVLFSALSNGARVLVNPGPVSDEISGMVGEGWIIEVGPDLDRVAAALSSTPPAPPRVEWGDPMTVARAHLEFMERI